MLIMQLHGRWMLSSEFLTFCDALQAARVHFAETGSHVFLCMLQPTVLTIYSLGGELHSVPLACKFTQIWPLPRGLILAVGQALAFDCCMQKDVNHVCKMASCKMVQYMCHADLCCSIKN